MREIHIAAGLLAIVLGFLALSARKGSTLHRRAGTLFVVSMLVMTAAAAVSAGWLRPSRVNFTAALLTLYLVITAWLTVKRPVAEVRATTFALALWGLAVAGYAATLAVEGFGSPRGLVDGIPAPPLVMFALAGGLGGLLDLRVLHAGQIAGKHRLARHLWRMTFAFWIAAASFFLGQARWFPEPVRRIEYLAIPVVLILLALVYWLVKTLRGRTPAIARAD